VHFLKYERSFSLSFEDNDRWLNVFSRCLGRASRIPVPIVVR
jgi:hypothetical protein